VNAPLTPGLVFDERTHQHFLDGVELPSITRVLRMAGIDVFPRAEFVSSEAMARAAERGRAVHEATALDDMGDLDPETVDPLVAGYLEGWRRFRADTKFVPDPRFTEAPLASGLMGYAGIPDRGGHFPNPAAAGRDIGDLIANRVAQDFPAVVEIKAVTELHDRIGIQLAAQGKLLAEHGFFAVKHVAVQLRPDGTYRMREYLGPLDREMFFSALRIVTWRLNHGEAIQ
jgi:hypothetical protein